MGCGDDNPAGSSGSGGGSFPASATGANTPVTSANAATVWANTFVQAFTVFSQGFTLTSKPVTPFMN